MPNQSTSSKRRRFVFSTVVQIIGVAFLAKAGFELAGWAGDAIVGAACVGVGAAMERG